MTPASPLPSAPAARHERLAGDAGGLLIVGCGDIGLRVARLLRGRLRCHALTSSPERLAELRAAGLRPVVADLDDPTSLDRIAGLADRVLHLAPPAAEGERDRRTRALLRVLLRGGRVRRIVYGSTTGVYGNLGGAWVDETCPVAPATDRARRRVDAEAALRDAGRRPGGPVVTVLRIPGIYATDRPGGDPRARLRRGTPVLRAEDDVHTNHIHADDLARACVAALFRGRPQRIVHAVDRTELKMGDYFDLVAELSGLARPPRITRGEAAARFSELQMSFMNESRRLLNRRLEHELRLRLRYPTVHDGLPRGAG